MIGKTGNGKSASGNSILRRRAFDGKYSLTSVTKTKSYHYGEFNGRVIKVVEGPGLGDFSVDDERSTKFALEGMRNVVTANPSGYHAFLLVLRYGGRFTVEDLETIYFLKSIFGENFVKNNCILVLSCGDNFESYNEESGLNFQEWCSEQGGVFAELFNECEKRVVLFDNKTKDESKKMAQLSELMKMVDSLSTSGNRFKNEDFIREHDARIQLLLGDDITVKEEYLNDIGLICNVLKNFDFKENPTDHIDKLNKLLKKTKILFANITQLEKRPGVHRDCAEIIIEIEKRIKLAQDAKQEEKDEKIETIERQRLAFENEAKAHRENVANLHTRLEKSTNEIKELKEELHRRDAQFDLQIQQLKADNIEKESRNTALQSEQRLIIARQKEDIDKLHNMMENIFSVLKSNQTFATESLASLKSIEGLMKDINGLPIKKVQTEQMNQLLGEIGAKFDEIAVN